MPIDDNGEPEEWNDGIVEYDFDKGDKVFWHREDATGEIIGTDRKVMYEDGKQLTANVYHLDLDDGPRARWVPEDQLETAPEKHA